MKRILQFISLVGLLLTIIPPVIYFLGKMSHSNQNLYMLIGAILWFISSIFWLGKKGELTDN